jgi:hypothetical protein
MSLLLCIFRVPNKGALPPGFHYRAPIERDIPFPEPFLYLSLEVPSNGTPPLSKFAQWGPCVVKCPFTELHLLLCLLREKKSFVLDPNL